MPLSKKLRYFFGILMCFFAAILISDGEPQGFISGISFFLIALIIFPIFDSFCKLFNRRFTVTRKILLGIATFLLVPLGFNNDEFTYNQVYIFLIMEAVLWILMFTTNKKKYVDAENKQTLKLSNKKGFFYKMYNKVIDKRNKEVEMHIEDEESVKEIFANLDILTVHAIGMMLSELQEKSETIFNSDMPKANVTKLIMSFCSDIININNEFELNDVYTSDYYWNKFSKYCPSLEDYLKEKIMTSRRFQNKKLFESYYRKTLNIYFEEINTFSGIKFHKTIFQSTHDFGEDRLFQNDYSNYEYISVIKYIVDLMACCTCIAKMMFVEKIVRLLDENNEFYKIIANMRKEINNDDTISKKSRPIYDEFYKSSLGFIDDEILYNIAIAIISNKSSNKHFSKKIENLLNLNDDKYSNTQLHDKNMKEWLFEIAKNNKDLEINKLVIVKICRTIKDNDFYMLINCLSNTKSYINYYYSLLKHNNKLSDKERYLKGDFKKEKEELSGKYTLNNIVSGTQFELYLVNLFKDLGYKVKHNGKSGDQGADLIVKKGDYVYAIQAKYYTGKLSNSPVQEITGALKLYNANQGVVITNSEFTSGAEELAKANSVILIDGKDLKKLVDYTFDDEHEEDVLKKFDK